MARCVQERRTPEFGARRGMQRLTIMPQRARIYCLRTPLVDSQPTAKFVGEATGSVYRP